MARNSIPGARARLSIFDASEVRRLRAWRTTPPRTAPAGFGRSASSAVLLDLRSIKLKCHYKMSFTPSAPNQDSELASLRRQVESLKAEIQTLRDERKSYDSDTAGALSGFSYLQSIQEGFVAFDPAWRFLECNQNAEVLLRRSAGELRGRLLWDELPELIGTPTEAALRRTMSERVVEYSELYFAPLGGWFQGRIYPMPSGGGVFALFSNITERKTAEAALVQNEKRWRNLANAIPQFVWVVKSYGDVLFLNDYWYEYTGLPKGETDFEAIHKPVHPEDLKLINDMWRKALAEGREQTFEYRVRRASDGLYRWHRGFHRPERNGDGDIIRWIGSGFDIHDLKLAVEALGKITHLESDAAL